MSRLIISLILTLGAGTITFGQVPILRSVPELDGLSVIDFQQDENGLLWFIDAHGLYSFDGIDLENRVSIPDTISAFSTFLLVDNMALIGTTEGHVLKSQGQRLVLLTQPSSQRVKSMLHTDDGLLLIAADGAGLHLHDLRDSAKPDRQVLKELKYVNDMRLINGLYYFATDNGIWKSDGLTTYSPTRIEDSYGICNVLETGKQHSLWTATLDGKIFRFDLQDKSSELIGQIDRNRIRDLEWVDGDIYVATDKGMFTKPANRENSSGLQQVSSQPCRSLYLDDEGDLWSADDGATQVANMYFSKWSFINGTDIHAMAMFQSKLVLGTDSGIIRFDPKTELSDYIKIGVNITSLVGSESLLIAGTYDSGLIIYENGRELVLTTEDGLSDNTVLDVHLRDDRELIVSTLGGVQRWIKSRGNWIMTKHFTDLSANYILTILTDGVDLWLGTDNKGVILIRGEEIQKIQSTENGAPIGSIPSITKRSDGSIWMLSEEAGLLSYTSAGLQSIESPHGTWGKYSSLVGLPSGMLFLIGERDVVMYDPDAQELMEFKEELDLKSGESFYNNYTLEGSNLTFEHNATLYQFHDIHSEFRTHTLTSISRVEVDLEPIDTSQHVFSEKESNFAFHFNGLLYRNPNLVNYRYRLVGYEDEWRHSRDREARYYRLPVGDYTFQIQSSHDLIGDESQPVSYAFEIQPLLYNRIWFRGIILGAIILVLWWWYQRRRANQRMTERMEKLNIETQLLTLKGQLDPHFLFNSFNTVIGLIEEDQERSIAYVEHLTDFYRMVLELGQEELISIQTEVKLLKIYLHLLEERFGKAVLVKIDSDLGAGLIPPMALQLLVENAVKHNVCTDKQPLNIWIEKQNEYISVKNDLRPKNGHNHSFGLGLRNLKERYRLLINKEVSVEISDDIFEVRLPRFNAVK